MLLEEGFAMSEYADDRADAVWSVIAAELNDRGCFNGIDDDMMDEIDAACIRLVHAALTSASQVAEAA